MKSQKAKEFISLFMSGECGDLCLLRPRDAFQKAVELAEQELTEQYDKELKERIKEAREKAEYMSELVLEQCKNDMIEKAIEAYKNFCPEADDCYWKNGGMCCCAELQDFTNQLNS